MQAANHLQNHLLKILVCYHMPPSAPYNSSVIINAALTSSYPTWFSVPQISDPNLSTWRICYSFLHTAPAVVGRAVGSPLGRPCFPLICYFADPIPLSIPTFNSNYTGKTKLSSVSALKFSLTLTFLFLNAFYTFIPYQKERLNALQRFHVCIKVVHTFRLQCDRAPGQKYTFFPNHLKCLTEYGA